MSMGSLFKKTFLVSSVLAGIAVFSGCNLSRRTTGDAVSAKDEIRTVTKKIEAKDRYRITDDDLALLKQNGLLDETNRLALGALSPPQK